ncbi:hypothetical protein MRB53_014090 [Persea americana]|uniref:Uncharacterized protein n=1 Tax=Persea americana TaxID=3435 RepID=A0ACC2K9T7_PERAE|nr:hypothetical protein MRB53_014090 [Persea americana]
MVRASMLGMTPGMQEIQFPPASPSSNSPGINGSHPCFTLVLGPFHFLLPSSLASTTSSTDTRERNPQAFKLPQSLDSPSRKAGKISRQEIHSVPDSLMMGMTSSFSSTSSASCLSNLPPIRDHVNDGGGQSGLVLEEHFSQLNVGGDPTATISPFVGNPSRVFSDDERLEQAMARMTRKLQQNPSQM